MDDEPEENHDENSRSICQSMDSMTIAKENTDNLDQPLGHLREVLDLLKELLMIERTFAKELKLTCSWIQDFLQTDICSNFAGESSCRRFLSLLESLSDVHDNYLAGLEECVNNRIREMDSLLTFPQFKCLTNPILECLQFYQSLTECLPHVIDNLDKSFKQDRNFERSFREFENNRGCYLPLTSFLTKPLFQPRSLFTLFQCLRDSVETTQQEHEVLDDNFQIMDQYLTTNADLLSSLLNSIYVVQLQRDMIGMNNISHRDSIFVRQGVLLRLSEKGYQPRMFFLFNNVLIYCSRSSTSSLQFKVHGTLSLEKVIIEEEPCKTRDKFPFTIFGGDLALMVAATSENDRHIWIRDINRVAASVNTSASPAVIDDSSSFSTELLNKIDQAFSEGNTEETKRSFAEAITATNKKANTFAQKHLQVRTNIMAHVFWHRNCSLGRYEYEKAFATCLSGYLLRKLRSSSGWQRLWVVFSGLSLFLYKSCQDDFPLASLPLLGYSLSLPTQEDNINKDLVFKLVFKTHVYYFRADNEYHFRSWMKAIRTASIQIPS